MDQRRLRELAGIKQKVLTEEILNENQSVINVFKILQDALEEYERANYNARNSTDALTAAEDFVDTVRDVIDEWDRVERG